MSQPHHNHPSDDGPAFVVQFSPLPDGRHTACKVRLAGTAPSDWLYGRACDTLAQAKAAAKIWINQHRHHLARLVREATQSEGVVA
jgi:hypothetical protein